MNIVVCVKQVPDTAAEKKLNPADNTLDREGTDAVLNELDEFAIEEALRITEANGGEVTIVTVGPARALEAVRKALSMGAHKAIHVQDDAIHGSDAVATSLILSKAIATTEYDLVLTSSEASDARTSVVPALLAERLGLPQLTFANKVELDGGNARVHRQTDDGYDVVEAALPAVVSVVERTNEPRYPSFKGIMAAKKKPVTTLSLADLGLDASEVGLAGAWTEVVDFAARPPRSAGTIVKDEGDGGAKLADFLASQKFI